jgi:hypothetical protein
MAIENILAASKLTDTDILSRLMVETEDAVIPLLGKL